MDVDGAGGMEVDLCDEETINLRDEQAAYPRSNGNGNGMVNRRRSMSHEEQQQRRASIKAILADESMPIQERRRSIQTLMDGRRSSIGTASVASAASASSHDDNPYGYGDSDEYGGHNNNNQMPSNSNANGGVYMGIMDSTEVCEPVSNEATKRAEQTRPPCTHYVRNCSLVSPCCGATFGCRICHDDSPILPPLLIQRQAMRRHGRSSSMPMNPNLMFSQTPEDTHHNIDRFAIKEVICRKCYTRQSSKT